MAQRLIRIALSSSIPDPIANASIFLDGNLIFKDWVPNQRLDPMIFDHQFQEFGIHTIKIILNNDYLDEEKDLNLIVNYIRLSDTSLNFTPYEYLTYDESLDLRIMDNSYIETATVWNVDNFYELDFNVDQPLIWIDKYQFNIDSNL